MNMTTKDTSKLAIDGGAPAVTQPVPPMFPGGMRIGAEEEEAVLEVLRSKRLFRYHGPTPGPSKVEELEQAFAAHMGAKYCVAVSSGTGSLMGALAGLSIGPGDEVIVPAYTWIATASAVFALGGVPIIAEVDESLTLDPTDVERKITPHTKVIIAVHMRGGPCRMEELQAIAQRHRLRLMEDTAQSDGASYRGKHLGSIAEVGAFSLQFNKVITAGEGGLIITNDETIWRRALMFHDVIGGARNGIPADEILPGINFRMSELQGAVALAQLKKLDGLIADMRRNHAMLKASMAELAHRKGITFRDSPDPDGDAGLCLVFFLPEIELARRVAAALEAEGVPATTIYSGQRDYHVYCDWAPIMNQRSWSAANAPWAWHDGPLEYRRDMCPRTLDLVQHAVHIDVSPDLTNTQLEEMADGLNKVLGALA
jgi:dTDP-4-amino-4,6-dideoxygalactose transaminase